MQLDQHNAVLLAYSFYFFLKKGPLCASFGLQQTPAQKNLMLTHVEATSLNYTMLKSFGWGCKSSDAQFNDAELLVNQLQHYTIQNIKLET